MRDTSSPNRSKQIRPMGLRQVSTLGYTQSAFGWMAGEGMREIPFQLEDRFWAILGRCSIDAVRMVEGRTESQLHAFEYRYPRQPCLPRPVRYLVQCAGLSGCFIGRRGLMSFVMGRSMASMGTG